jgi:protein-S-isoprenylcysteine O-methyltransferase Ste14
MMLLAKNAVIISFEEDRLQKNFGIEYERYKTSVRRWL